MSLTTSVELELVSAGFEGAFENQRAVWTKMATVAYTYTSQTVEGTPKPDDVAPHLALALEIREEFLIARGTRTAKKWFRYFADLIIDRAWRELTKEKDKP